MADYNLNDDQLQQRYEDFRSDSLALDKEISLLRVILESALQKGQNRLALDAIAQISKACVVVEAMQIRRKELLHRSTVLHLMQKLSDVIHDEMQCLPQDQRVKIIDNIALRARECAKHELLLLEAE